MELPTCKPFKKNIEFNLMFYIMSKNKVYTFAEINPILKSHETHYYNSVEKIKTGEKYHFGKKLYLYYEEKKKHVQKNL
jgi:hypothetical protein